MCFTIVLKNSNQWSVSLCQFNSSCLLRFMLQVLSKYRSGKLPKAFKIIPALSNWEQVLYLTEPETWTAAAMYQATRWVGCDSWVWQLCSVQRNQKDTLFVAESSPPIWKSEWPSDFTTWCCCLEFGMTLQSTRNWTSIFTVLWRRLYSNQERGSKVTHMDRV